MEEAPKGGLRLPGPRPPEHIQTSNDQQACSSNTTTKPDDDKIPIRVVEEWRPNPLLCKRFDVQDPFHGNKAPDLKTTEFQTYQLNLPGTLGNRIHTKDGV